MRCFQLFWDRISRIEWDYFLAAVVFIHWICSARRFIWSLTHLNRMVKKKCRVISLYSCPCVGCRGINRSRLSISSRLVVCNCLDVRGSGILCQLWEEYGSRVDLGSYRGILILHLCCSQNILTSSLAAWKCCVRRFLGSMKEDLYSVVQLYTE